MLGRIGQRLGDDVIGADLNLVWEPARHPGRTAAVVLLNTFYASAPTLRLPEFIELFATPSLKALSQYFLQNPALFAELLQFQRGQFRAALAEE